MPRHAEQRQLPHRADQMFDLVADVARYPEFLPWCRAARIRSSSETELVADLVIGFKGITERFTSRVTLDKGAMVIETQYEDGPFKYLTNRWEFLSTDDDTACVVDFFVDFEFRSKFLSRMIGIVFTEAVKRMVAAFETRADSLYGK